METPAAAARQPGPALAQVRNKVYVVGAPAQSWFRTFFTIVGARSATNRPVVVCSNGTQLRVAGPSPELHNFHGDAAVTEMQHTLA